MTNAPRPFWHPDIHADRRPRLLARNRIKTAIRRWFEDQGFVEVETGCLQVSPGNETHLHAFATSFATESAVRHPLYLHTSPEFACKKLLAAGETRIFTFAPVFRNGETGPLHAPEFTMLEWYRTGEPYTRLMDDCRALLACAAEATGNRQWSYRDATADPTRYPDRATVDEMFASAAGIQLLDNALRGDGTPDRDALARAVAAAGIRIAADDNWSDLFSRVLVERIEPALRQGTTSAGASVFLDEYPTHEAALARPTPHDPRVAERFELYVCGVELANAFGELTDPTEQRRRLVAEMDEKQRIYAERYPIDEDFLAAVAAMPPASGCALGFDRLVMLATGANHINQVLWTPMPELGTTPS